jgi:hypothetical protein
MLVISRQAPAPMDPDTHIRNVTMDPQLTNICPVMYLPQLNSNRMGEYGTLRHKKMLISVRFIPNYRLG